MKKWSYVGFLVPLALVATYCVGASHLNGTPSSPRSEWLTATYELILKELDQSSKFTLIRPGQKRLVSIQIIPDSGVERLFYLEVKGDSVRAEIVEPRGASLFNQLEQLAPELHVEDVSKVISLLRVSRKTVGSNECPGLKGVVDELQALDVRLVDTEELYIHPTEYRVRIRTLWGDEFSIRFLRPDSAYATKTVPLLAWIQKLDTVLTKFCG